LSSYLHLIFMTCFETSINKTGNTPVLKLPCARGFVLFKE
jgi:hypothetical protein